MLALTIVGLAAPSQPEPEYWMMQRRLLPHSNRIVQRLFVDGFPDMNKDPDSNGAFHDLGDLYADQGKLAEAEKMYQRALDGYEKALGPDHPSTLRTVNDLRLLTTNQDEHMKGEEIHERTLDRDKEIQNVDQHSRSPSSNAKAALNRLKARLLRKRGGTFKKVNGSYEIQLRRTESQNNSILAS